MKGILLKGSKGVTVLELMIVLIIIALITALALPHYLATMPIRRLKADAMDVASNMKYAKMKAVQRNANVGLHFFPNEEAYIVFMDSDDNNQYTSPNDAVIKTKIDMRGGIRFDRASADWTVANDSIIFSPNGSAMPASGTVVIANNQNDIRKVVVAPITGSVRIAK